MPTKKRLAAPSFAFSKRTERRAGAHQRLAPTEYVLRFLLGCAAFLGIFAVTPFAADVHQYPKVLLFSATVCIAAGWWFMQQMLRKEVRVVSLPAGRAVAILLCGIFLSVLNASDHARALFGMPDQVGVPAVAIGSLVLFLFLAVQSVKTLAQLRHAVGFFWAALFAGCLFFFFRTFVPFAILFPRLGLSLFAFSPAVTGFFGVILAVYSGGMLLCAATVPRWRLVFSWLAFVVGIALTVLVGQRTAWLGIGVGLAPLLALRIRAGWRSRPGATGVVVGVALGAVLASVFSLPATFRLAVPVESAITLRETWDVTRAVVTTDARSFLFGQGFGSFPQAFAKHRPISVNTAPTFSVVAAPASSMLLSFFAEAGTFSLLAFVVFAVILARALLGHAQSAARRLVQKDGVEKEGMDAAALQCSVGAALLAALVASVSFPPTFSVVVALMSLCTALCVSYSIARGLPTREVLSTRLLSRSAFRFAAIGIGIAVWLVAIALLVDRGIAEYYYAKGMRALVAGHAIEARAAVTQADRYLPGDRRVALGMAQTTVALAEESNAPDALRDEARQRLATLVEIASADPGILLGVASTAARLVTTQPDAAAVVRDALRALDQIAPENPAIQLLLGDAYIQTQQEAFAPEHYARAVALRPGFVDAYLHWAQFAAHAGDAQTALDLGTQAARVAPYAREPLVFVANILLTRRAPGDENRAILVLQTLLGQQPNDEQAQLVLAGVLESVRRFDEAEALYKKLQAVHPENTSFQQSLSRIAAARDVERASSTPQTTPR